MFNIAGALLGGLILSWFGFDNVVTTGMLEVFGKSISMTGYYFLFGLLGALRSIGFAFNPNAVQKPINLDLNKYDLNKYKKK